MTQAAEIARTFAGMPSDGFVAIVVLGGFALAGFAIYVVFSLAKDRR